MTRKIDIELAPSSLERVVFNLGKFPESGAYSCELNFNVGDRVAQKHLGWLGVFPPNNARVNRSPIWYNEPDLGGYQGRAEDYFHSLEIPYPLLKEAAPGLRRSRRNRDRGAFGSI